MSFSTTHIQVIIRPDFFPLSQIKKRQKEGRTSLSFRNKEAKKNPKTYL